MSSDKQLIAHTAENARQLRSALVQNPYFMHGKWREATDEEVFAYAEGLIRGVRKAAPAFRATAESMARAWGDMAKALVKLNRVAST